MSRVHARWWADRPDCTLDLLLLLTAFLASLTGVGAADRGVRQIEGVAVVRAAEVAEAVAQPARCAVPQTALAEAVGLAAVAWPIVQAAPLSSLYFPFERRLE